MGTELELKPCPYCGGKMTVSTEFLPQSSGHWCKSQSKCKSCGSKGPEIFDTKYGREMATAASNNRRTLETIDGQS